jgi:hypothetical protein
VSAGPVRLFAFAAAVVVGLLARPWRGNFLMIFWLASVALGIRCLFEPVMIPYYVMPCVALSFIVAARNSRLRLAMTLASGFGLIVMTYSHSDMWTYWIEMTALMAAMCASARPSLSTEIVAGIGAGAEPELPSISSPELGEPGPVAQALQLVP